MFKKNTIVHKESSCNKISLSHRDNSSKFCHECTFYKTYLQLQIYITYICKKYYIFHIHPKKKFPSIHP